MALLHAETQSLPAGGGPFRLPQLTLGLFLSDQPAHRLSVGGDRATPKPLRAQEGWLMPAGAEGRCEFDDTLDLVTVSLDARLLREAGLDGPEQIAPQIGAFDPLTVQMALAAHSFGGADALYRQTMERALAAQIARLAGPPPVAGPALDDPRLRRVAAAVQDAPEAAHSLESLAALAAMSPHHFARAFKAATGTSPLQFVIAARLDRAKVLLRTTRLPVAEIAWRTGYEDTSRFTRHFKRATGATPAAWRAG